MRINIFTKVILVLIFLSLPVFAFAEEKEPVEEEISDTKDELVFFVDQGSFFFFQPSEGKIYRYGPRGTFTKEYTLKELGEDFE